MNSKPITNESITILQRYSGNPILTASSFPKPINSVFNAGITKYKEGYVLLTRVEYLSGSSCLWAAHSSDGIHFIPDPQPAMIPTSEEPFSIVENFSIEDPRIIPIDGSFYITYVGYSKYDCATLLARTNDFHTYERVSILTLPDNKDVVLFPEKINGFYTKLDRPMTQTSRRGDIWISFSPDLIHWGGFRPVMTPRSHKWDSLKIGAGAPPIKVPEGWLLIYHGVRATFSGALYRLGAVLLDADEPWKVIGRADDAILSPAAPEDYMGDVGNVVFTCGVILEDDGELKVYYGAADQVMCLASAPVSKVIDLCLAGKPEQIW